MGEEEAEDINVKVLFGRNLKRLRGLAKLSQVDLSVEANVAHNFINDIENGKKWVSAETIEKLSKALKVKPYQFFISGSILNAQDGDALSFYMDDFADTLANVIKEHRHRYFSQKPEGE